MEAREKEALYRKMVSPGIKRHMGGIIELPISALQQYCTEAGYAEDDVVFFTLTFPNTEDGVYNYVLGPDCAEDAVVVAMSVYYYDYDTDVEEEIAPNQTLTEAVYRKFYDGEVSFNGDLKVDQYGRVWIDGMSEENIRVEFLIGLQPDKKGYEFLCDDGVRRMRLWFDGKTFFCERITPIEAARSPC